MILTEDDEYLLPVLHLLLRLIVVSYLIRCMWLRVDYKETTGHYNLHHHTLPRQTTVVRGLTVDQDQWRKELTFFALSPFVWLMPKPCLWCCHTQCPPSLSAPSVAVLGLVCGCSLVSGLFRSVFGMQRLNPKPPERLTIAQRAFVCGALRTGVKIQTRNLGGYSLQLFRTLLLLVRYS